MIRPLVIGGEERARINDCIERAAAHVTPLLEVLRLSQLKKKVWAPNLEYTVEIPRGYRVTYTHEEQRQCVCRHISISVEDARPGYGPSVDAVRAILEEFGFINRLHELPGWTLRSEDGSMMIVEFIEPLDGNVELLRQPQVH